MATSRKRGARAAPRTARQIKRPPRRAPAPRPQPRPKPDPRPAAAPVDPQARAREGQERFQAFWKTVLERVRATGDGPEAPPRIHHAALTTPAAGWLLLTAGLHPKGLELLMRVPRAKEDPAPPAWALQAFGELVSAAAAPGAVPFSSEQVRSLGPSVAPPGGDLAGFAFAPDPVVAPLVPPGTGVVPLVAVGLTREEARLVREWSPQGLLEVLSRLDPQLLTDPDRQSLLQSPRARTAIEQRVEREGSSLSVMQAARSELAASGGKTTWRLSAEAVDTVVSLLKGRTGHQRPFTVLGPDSELKVVPADHPGVALSGEKGTLSLSQAAARLLRATLRAAPGRYAVEALPGLTIEVL